MSMRVTRRRRETLAPRREGHTLRREGRCARPRPLRRGGRAPRRREGTGSRRREGTGRRGPGGGGARTGRNFGSLTARENEILRVRAGKKRRGVYKHSNQGRATLTSREPDTGKSRAKNEILAVSWRAKMNCAYQCRAPLTSVQPDTGVSI